MASTNTKAEKAANEEYSEQPEVGVQGAAASGVPKTWRLGEVAPKTLYINRKGKVQATEFEEGGKILIAEGDVVRRWTWDQLHPDAARRSGPLGSDDVNPK